MSIFFCDFFALKKIAQKASVQKKPKVESRKDSEHCPLPSSMMTEHSEQGV